jgi:hypothetical protein
MFSPFKIILFSNILVLSVPDEGYSKTRGANKTWYLRFYYYRLVDTSAGGLIVPKVLSVQ